MAGNRLFHWTVAAIGSGALGPTGNALAQQSAEYLAGPKISIVIEEGERAPSQVLDAIAAREIGSGSGNVTFSISEGRGILAGPNQVVDAASGGAIAHAEIVAGPNYDETIIRILVDGKPAGRALRVGTIASGSIGQLLSKDVPDGSEALLARGADYAVVDMDMVRSQTPAENSEAPTGQYCATILDKERDVYGHSRVLGRGCSEGSDGDALAKAQSTAIASGASVQYVTYIIGFAEHAGYGGQFQKVYGCCGDCDWAGYSISTSEVSSFWYSNLSSTVRPYGRCYYVKYKKSLSSGGHTDWGSTRTLSDWYVGDYYNDHIYAVHVWG